MSSKVVHRRPASGHVSAAIAGLALLVAIAACQRPEILKEEAAAPTNPAATLAAAQTADLAESFSEPFHGFVFLAPLAVGPGDAVTSGNLDPERRFVRLDAVGGRYTSRIVEREEPFTELLPSWNVAAPQGSSFRVDVRVGRRSEEHWSPWLLIGDWGTPVAPRYTRFEGGKVAVDVFESDEPWDRAQLRIEGTGGVGELRLHRASLAFTDDRALAARVTMARTEAWPAPVAVRVPVRSQRDEDAEIAGSVCSPTSVAMVMELNGVDVPTAQLAAEVRDPTHKIFGNWSRAVQGAFTHGVPGSLVRISSWDAVAEFLQRRMPLVASIKAGEGELAGAPYSKTAGHLLVVTGIGPAGQVMVNDPAARWPGDVRRVYRREDLERCWFESGGIAYAFDPMPARVETSFEPSAGHELQVEAE